MLAEWGRAAALRHRILDPRTAPAESLDWLGATLGLAMDPCWSERARRCMVAEASALFRIRGTVDGLRRMLEILTGGRAIIVEKFRLRGGGVVGNPEATRSRSVLGAGFRVGGAIGQPGEGDLPSRREDPGTAAHRFTVMLVARLSPEQMSCVRRLVEAHKPSHTLADICTVETGARVGLGLHVGLASAVGRSSGFGRAVVGEGILGRGDVLGRPELGRRPAPAGEWRPQGASCPSWRSPAGGRVTSETPSPPTRTGARWTRRRGVSRRPKRPTATTSSASAT
jgi:phage tail-like protein